MNYYEVLDVSRTATQKDIRRAYLELAQIYHPDRLRGMRPNVRKRAEDKMKIISDISSGLRYLSKVGVVHRDLKPGNILKSKNGQWKIADFGFANDI